MSMSLGEKIRELRKLNGMSQEYLAEMMEVSRQSISKWENDLAEPSSEKLFKLADVLNVSVVELRNPNSRVELVLNMRKEIVTMKKSKPLIAFIIISLIIFISLFLFGIYANFSGNYAETTILYLMIASAVFMCFAFLPVFIYILNFVYKDCKSRGIKPTFWVIISTTFLGLAYYLIKRDSLV